MSRRLTTEEFIAKAREVHGDRYDYSLVEYKTARDKVSIVCAGSTGCSTSPQITTVQSAEPVARYAVGARDGRESTSSQRHKMCMVVNMTIL